MILNCWHCKNDFEYEPPALTASKPPEFFQGSTVCKDCVPCMGHNDKCKHFVSQEMEKAAGTMTIQTEPVY